MLVIIAVLAIASAALLLFRYMKRRDLPLPSSELNYSLEPPPNARPLFAPSDEDLRREIKEHEAREIARREYHVRATAREAVDEALIRWRDERDPASAAELLRVTTTCGIDGAFSRAAREILDDFNASRTNRVDAGDLAALLDSHLRTLPSEERSSGEVFWLKEEIADLRRKAVLSVGDK